MKTIVKIGNVSAGEREAAAQHKVDLLSYSELYAEGESNPAPHNPPQPEDVATICYTSGTTGTFYLLHQRYHRYVLFATQRYHRYVLFATPAVPQVRFICYTTGTLLMCLLIIEYG